MSENHELDMQHENIIELVDEEGNEVSFEHLMTLEHEGKAYICLVPVEPLEDVEEDELVISVSDNGFGLSPEKTEELNRLIHQSELDQPSNTSGVGLINVARRIQIARGNEFGMYISSALQVGTTVTLKLPIRKED